MMSEIYNSAVMRVTQDEHTPQEGWRGAWIYLDSRTFGLPTRQAWTIGVSYDPRNNFNIEAPVCSPKVHVEDVLPDMIEDDEPDEFTKKYAGVMEAWPAGYSLEDVEVYAADLLDDGIPFYKPSLSTTCPPIDGSSLYWIHPEHIRLMENEEMAAMKGVSDVNDWRLGIPDAITAWIMRQVQFCESHAWGDLDVETEFSAFDLNGPVWNNEEVPGKEMKTFDLEKYYVH